MPSPLAAVKAEPPEEREMQLPRRICPGQERPPEPEVRAEPKEIPREPGKNSLQKIWLKYLVRIRSREPIMEIFQRMNRIQEKPMMILYPVPSMM